MGLNKNGDLMNGHLLSATCGRDLRSGVAERSCGVELQATYELPPACAPKTAEASSPENYRVDTEDLPIDE